MRRIVFLLFSLLALFSCTPSAPLQTNVAVVDSLVKVTFNDTTNLYFRITAADEARLTWDATEGKKYNTPGRYQHKGRLVVPAQITVDGKVYNVTSVGDNALFQQRSLTEIYLSDGIRHIGNKALSGCDKLKKLRLPATLETVGDEAIARCKQLVEVKLPNALRKMGKAAMYDCKSLRKVEIPRSMTVVPEELFSGCFSLKKVVFSNNVTTIGERAFSCCELLEDIEFPNSVNEIKAGLFERCSSLRRVRLSRNIKDIPEDCFLACLSLEKIDFTNIENIGAGAFVACNSMGNFNLPEGVKTIGEGAFASCAGIEEIRLPLSLEYVGDEAFANCRNLKDIYLLRIKPIKIDSEMAFPPEPCRINIPKGSIDSYQFTAKWKKFNYREYTVGKK